MNKFVILLATISLIAGAAKAQNVGLESDIDAQLDSVTSSPVGPQGAQGTPTGAAIAPTGSVGSGSQPIYILNQATPTSNAQVQSSQVQKQPQVDIVAAPLQKSRAEQIRDARQQIEVETENKIVEKLEMARMEDERRRASTLFGEAQQAPVVAAPVVVAPPVQAVQVQPAVVAPVVVKEDNTRDIVRDELRAAMQAEEMAAPEKTEQKYFSAIVGVGEYPDVRNVRGNYVIGANFGTKFDDSYAIEGTFTYGNYTVDQANGNYYMNSIYVPRAVDVQQYTGSLAVKYLFLDGIIKPVIGGLAQYSYRTFGWSEDQYSSYYGNSSNRGSGANSHAVDLGVVVGADVEFSKKYSLGLDFRYLWNMASRINLDNQSAFLESAQFGTPIEKLQYYTMSIVGRVNF